MIKMVIHEMSADEKTRELARLREKALHDEASELATARKEGVEEGIQQAKNKLISKLRAKGMSEEEIKEFLED